MPAGRARWAPRAMAPDRKSERVRCDAHRPGLPRNAVRPARGAARDRPGRSSRCGPASLRGRGRRQRTQARTDSRSCCLAVPGRCRARHARHVPEAAARQITKPDSAVRSCRDDRRSRSVAIACRKAPTRPRPGEFPRRGVVVARRLHRALHVRCPAARCRSRGSGTPRCPLPAGCHRLPTAHPPRPCQWRQWGHQERAVTNGQPGNALPGDVDVIGEEQARTDSSSATMLRAAGVRPLRSG